MIAKLILTVLVGAVGPVLSVEAQQLPSGLYKRLPPVSGHVGQAAELAPLAASTMSRVDRVERHEFASAFADAAQVEFALVASNPLTGQGKIVFAPMRMPQPPSSPRSACVAYALLGNDGGLINDGFCRAKSGPASEYEPRLEVVDEGFLIEWKPATLLERTEFIPPERAPSSAEKGACVMGVCRPEAYGRVVSHQLVTHFQDRFALLADLPFVEVRRLETSVDLYRQAGDDAVSATIPAGVYLAVRQPDGDWVEAASLKDDGSLLRGWIPRFSATPGRWVDQAAMSRAHRFRVAMSGSVEDEVRDTLAVQVIERGSGKTAQWIDGPIGSGDRAPEDEVLSLIDANFDGHLDIVMMQADGGAGPNDVKSVYLFDPASQRYTLNEVLSSLPQIQFDAKTKIVHSASRNSCCSHTNSRWRYVKGVLTMVAEHDETLTADGQWLEITDGRLVRGRMVYRTRRVAPRWD